MKQKQKMKLQLVVIACIVRLKSLVLIRIPSPYRTATCSWADTDVPNRKYENFPLLVVSFTDDKECLQHACHLGFFFRQKHKNNLHVQSSNVQNFISLFQLWVIFRPSNTGHMFFTKVWSSLCIWRLPRLFAHKYCFRFPIYNFQPETLRCRLLETPITDHGNALPTTQYTGWKVICFVYFFRQ